jgi:hypothetical protein
VFCLLQFLIVYDDLSVGVLLLQFLIVYDDLSVGVLLLQFLIVYDDLLVLATVCYNPSCLQSDARSASRIVTADPPQNPMLVEHKE